MKPFRRTNSPRGAPAIVELGATLQDLQSTYSPLTPAPARPAFQGQVFAFDTQREHISFRFSEGRLTEIIVNTTWFRSTPEARERKLRYFLDCYGGQSNFNLLLDNGFGYTLERRDRRVFVLYSYVCDIVTVGRMKRGRIDLPDWEPTE